ncbi:hypothetical protein D3C81_1936720 [compost metagenome]
MISTTSIIKLPNILSQVTPYIDTNLSVSDMWKLATVGYDSSMGGSEQIPPMDLLTEETTSGGSAVIGISSEEKLKQFVQDTMAEPEPSPSPEVSPGSSPSATD